MSRLTAGTACWLNNPHPGLKAGTAVLLEEDADRVHGERVKVRLENGKITQVTSLSLSSMLDEEIPDWARTTTLPFHYKDNGEACSWSGTANTRCPSGCSGAKTHYANDGHPECDEDVML